MRKIIIFLILSLFFVSLVPLASISSASPVAPDAVSAPVLGITTSMPHSNDIRDLPLNDSNIQEYPLWNITFYTSQHFSIEVGNKVMETGTGPISINLNLSTYESKYINVNVTVGSIIYHFKNIYHCQGCNRCNSDPHQDCPDRVIKVLFRMFNN